MRHPCCGTRRGLTRSCAPHDTLGNRTTAAFDAVGLIEATADGLGNRTMSVFDAAGRTVAQVDALCYRATTLPYG